MKELFSFMKIITIWSFYPWTLQTNNFCKYINVFQTTVIVAVWKRWMFLFLDFFCSIEKIFCILLSWLVSTCRATVMNYFQFWMTFLEIAKDLNTKALRSIAKFLISHSLRTLSVFTICLWQFISCPSFFIVGEMYTKPKGC